MRTLWLVCVSGLMAAALAQADPQLDDLLSQASERNPAVLEAFSRYRAALQRAPQVSALPDPELAFTQYARTPETRVGPQWSIVSVSQRFPWLSKLRAQGQQKEKEAAVMAALYEARKDEVARQVRLAYWDLAYADRAAAIAAEDLETLRHFETLAQARYSQGVGLQQAAVKLQAEITRGLNRLQTLRRRRVDLESTLNALCDREPSTPIGPVTMPEAPPVQAEVATLYAAAKDNRPELAAAFLRIETEEKRIDVARKQGFPELRVGAGYTLITQRSDPAGIAMPPAGNGKDVYSVTVGTTLPIFRRKYNAAVHEATEDFLASKHNYRGLWTRVQADIRSVSFDIETIQEQIRLFETRPLPQAEQALRSGESAYAAGEGGVLDLLDSSRTLLEIRLGLVQMHTDYLKALAELERAVGLPPVEVK